MGSGRWEAACKRGFEALDFPLGIRAPARERERGRVRKMLIPGLGARSLAPRTIAGGSLRIIAYHCHVCIPVEPASGEGRESKASSDRARSTWQSRHAGRCWPSSSGRAVPCPPSPVSLGHSSAPPPLLDTMHSTFSTRAPSPCSAAAEKSSLRGCPVASVGSGGGGAGGTGEKLEEDAGEGSS
jgi:hypothetical protein